MAMAVSGTRRHDGMRDVQRRHYSAMALRFGHAPSAEPLIERLIERTPHAIDEAGRDLPPGFPAKVADSIFDGLRRSVARLAAMPPPTS